MQTATQSTGMSYGYTYKSDSTQALETITVNGSTVKPKLDILGRNKGKEICIGSDKIAEESIVYRKVGDHATNMPASVYFGAYKAGRYALNEHLKYAYDEMGNIVSVKENGELIVRYAYDKLSRLVREDNKTFGKTWLYTYDNNGNILCKRETEFTLKTNVEECTFTKNAYTYDGDKLLTYNEEICEYDSIGNPKKYRGKAATWERGRQLISYDGHTFTYDAQGRRLTKDSVSFTYDSSGRLIKQSNGLEFFYDHTGVAGVKYDNKTYVYRKDVQGNIIALLDSNGVVMVKYVYDGWGNHGIEVVDSACETIANLNPFRYRSYYFDTETELYFLKTRYYDPEIGRFMTIDDISYLDPETINGLNLYAYCGNNPVMRVDENGNAWWNPFSWNWKKIGITLGAIALSIGTIALTVGTLGATAPVLTAGIIGGVAAFSTNVIIQGVSQGYGNIDWGHVAIQTVSGIAYGVANILLPGVGGMFVKAGISAVTSYATNRYDGMSMGSSFLNALNSFGISIGIQGVMKLNISSWMGKGRWVDYVGENIFDQNLIVLDFSNYLTRELTVAGVAFGSRFLKYIFDKLK